MKFLIDTNICIPYLNGTDSQLLKQFQKVGPDSLCLCAVVEAELLYGAQKSQKTAANLERLALFLSLLESFDFDKAAAERYGVLRVQLERDGTPIGGNDMMIAAIALAQDLTLVTRDLREFRRVTGLRVEEW